MGNYIRKFNSEINGKDINYFRSKLDYSLKEYQERKDIVDEIMEEFEPWYAEYIDNYYKFSPISDPNSSDSMLAEDNNVFKFIEQCASYLIYVDYDGSFLKNRRMKDLSHREIAVGSNEIVMLQGGIGDDMVAQSRRDANSLAEQDVEVNRKNYKLSIEQKIFSSDYDDEDLHMLKSYKDLKDELNRKKKEGTINNYYANVHIGYINHDMLMIKDQVKRTIYFKAPLPDAGGYDELDCLYLNDKEHARALLRMPPTLSLDHWMGHTVRAFNSILNKCKLTDDEKIVIDYLRVYYDETDNAIAGRIGIHPQLMAHTQSVIVSKYLDMYWKTYEDWYYLNIRKGKYKKCKGCGKILLTARYWEHRATKDGLRGKCIDCMLKQRKTAYKRSKSSKIK